MKCRSQGLKYWTRSGMWVTSYLHLALFPFPSPQCVRCEFHFARSLQNSLDLRVPADYYSCRFL